MEEGEDEEDEELEEDACDTECWRRDEGREKLRGEMEMSRLSATEGFSEDELG